MLLVIDRRARRRSSPRPAVPPRLTGSVIVICKRAWYSFSITIVCARCCRIPVSCMTRLQLPTTTSVAAVSAPRSPISRLNRASHCPVSVIVCFKRISSGAGAQPGSCEAGEGPTAAGLQASPAGNTSGAYLDNVLLLLTCCPAAVVNRRPCWTGLMWKRTTTCCGG